MPVRKALEEPDDALRERWAHYLRGYRAGGGVDSGRNAARGHLWLARKARRGS